MYEYGDVNYLEVLLGSKDISDFFSRIEYVGQMAEYDQGIQDNLEADRQKIQELEGQIQQTELELNLAKQKLEKSKEGPGGYEKREAGSSGGAGILSGDVSGVSDISR